jgi:hypothetical protein
LLWRPGASPVMIPPTMPATRARTSPIISTHLLEFFCFKPDAENGITIPLALLLPCYIL